MSDAKKITARFKERMAVMVRNVAGHNWGVGVSKSTLFLVGLGFTGMLAYSRRKSSEKQ